jgi:predicted ATPase/DNA-binding SARP family transcriptional activator
MPSLTVQLFGPLRVLIGGEPLPRLRTRSVEWLLALLVLRHGRAVDRSWLAGTLWPESDENQALHNLRDALVHLRKALGPESARLQSPTRHTLLLDLTAAEVDVVRFDAAVKAGDEASLRGAVELSTRPLLEGCLEAWVLPEREHREQACLMALEALAEAAERRGDYTGALALLRRAEALDNLRDSIQRRLMRVLTASGDTPAALLAYRDYRLRLHSELNLEPDADTVRLFQQIRAAAGETAKAASSTSSLRPSSPPSPHQVIRSGTRGAGDGHQVITPAPLPHPITALIGREQDVEEVGARIAASRLVTLAGAGGVGKTRLAIEAAREAAGGFPEGAAFVALASLSDPALLPSFVAMALDLQEKGATGTEARLQALITWLAAHPVLLVLDNCEHLIEAAAALCWTLLERCPRLHILATSRQRLGLTGEVVHRVPSLASPGPEHLPLDDGSSAATVMEYPAVQLFTERAQMVQPGFRLTGRADAEAVARICQRLDGIPLALELAAARVPVLPVTQIAARLDDRFRLLTSGGRGTLPRHRTLRALIDWSYDSLPEAEAALLRRLSVFAGGWTLEAAEAVVGGQWSVVSEVKDSGPELTTDQWPPTTDILDLLSSLEGRSLVLVEEADQGRRYRMLETVREYAREKLAACGEEATARPAHVAYLLELAETAEAGMRGPEQLQWLNVLEAEHDNLRAALAWCLEAAAGGEWPADRPAPAGSGEPQLSGRTAHPHPPATAIEAGLWLAAALQSYWTTRHYVDEGRRYLEALLSSPQAAGRTAARAAALYAAAALPNDRHDWAAARLQAEESLAICEEHGDQHGIARALNILSFLIPTREEARRLATRSLALSRACNDPAGTASVLTWLSDFARAAGDPDTARAYHQEALAIARSVGDQMLEAGCLSGLGAVERERRDYAAARDCFQSSLVLARKLGMHGQTAVSLYFLGLLAFDEGDFAAALAFWEECREVDRRNQSKGGAVLGRLAELAAVQGDYAKARACWEESLAEGRELGRADLMVRALRGLGDAARLEGDAAGALGCYSECLQAVDTAASHSEHKIADERHEAECAACLRGIAAILHRSGREEQAVRLLGAAEALAERVGATVPPASRSAYEEQIAELRKCLGAAAFAAAWAEGQASPLERAVESALAAVRLA